MRKVLIVLLIINALFVPIDIIVGDPWIAPINAIGAIASFIGLRNVKKLDDKCTDKNDILSEGG